MVDKETEQTRAFGMHSYQAKMFVPLIMDRIQQGMSLLRGDIINKLIEYVNVLPTPQFAKRVRQKTTTVHKN